MNLNLSKEELATHYYLQKMSANEVANKYKVSLTIVQKLQNKYNLIPLKEWERKIPDSLSDIQKEVLYGTLLGQNDYLLQISEIEQATLNSEHTHSEKDYAQLKQNIFNKFIRKPILHKYKRFGNTRYGFETVPHNDFYKLRKETYIGKQKSISLQWMNKLTPVSIAFWFQESCKRGKNKSLILETNKFQLDEIDIICKWFYKSLKIICKPIRQNDSKDYYIYFSNKTTEKLILICLPWTHPSMRYKYKGIIENPQRLNVNSFLEDTLLDKKVTV